MSTKAQALAQMAEQTAKQITSSRTGWTGFLTTVGRLYKYPYYEQLMIYAQRPDATACADFDLWNNTMRRYVRRGSKGIALIDPTGDTPRLRYVFDVKDTGGGEHSRRPFLWEMQDYHEAPVLQMLQDKFGENSENLSDAFYNIASALAKEYYDDHRADIPYIAPGSFLEEYDEDNIRVAFENAATVSIAYTLMQRCGLNPDEYFEHEDFLSVFDFNTADTVALLGTAVSEQSEQVFRQISITIAKTERERSKEHEQLNLQPERRLSDTRPHSDRAGTADRQIRQNEETVPHGTSDTLIPFPAAVRETVSPPIGDRPDSHQTNGADYGRLAESAASSRQEDPSDGMGRSYEQSQSAGRGNDTDGAYIQLTLFPSEQEQIQRIGSSEMLAPFSMPQTNIDHILRTGSNQNNSIFRIVSMYQKEKTTEENIAFLQKEFGTGGKGLYLDGTKVSVWYNEQGIHIAKGETALYSKNKQLIPWEKVEQRINELLSEGQFTPQDTFSDAKDYEYQSLAERLWYLHQNFSDDAPHTYFDEELFQGGFPNSTQQIAKLLREPAERKTIIAGLQQFAADYEQDRELLRFHFYQPKKMIAVFEDSRLPIKAFSSVLTDVPPLKMFLTQDEVDTALAHGNSFQNGKYRIYEFFNQPHSPKEKEDFLKNEYGTGGRTHALSGADNSYEDHSAKGLEYKRGEKDDKLHLKWNTVAKRIDYLIANDRYLTTVEKAQLAENQRENAGLTETTNEPVTTQSEIAITPQPVSATAPEAEPMAAITAKDIDSALQAWNGNGGSKARVLSYMQLHSRERGTAEWLKGEYGGNLPMFSISKGKNALEMPWAKVQRRIGQLVAEGAFYTEPAQNTTDYALEDEPPRYTVELTSDAYDEPFIIRDNTVPDMQDGRYYEVEDIYQTYMTEDEAQAVADRLNGITPEPMQAEQPEPPSETPTILYNIGDTVFLENGTPFLIEEISAHQVTLRDPSLFYPILRAESHESFTRLLERYPQPEKPQETAENFRITDTHLGEGSKREKIARNVTAITTLQTIERENRPATKAEQEILSAYVGWGGLPEVFDKVNSSFSSEYMQLKSLLSEDEYEMARASTLNAHYTSPTVIKAIYDTVERMGFSTGNILEPACGTGNFFGMLPEGMQSSKLYGVELDSITGRIAKQLYPSANIAITGFEKTELPDSFFDLAIGNVPFGNYKLGEKRYDNQNFLIHDHFFAKALDKVRPSGVVAFVTSKGTMDKQSPEVRRYLAQRAELLGAIRLPNNAFLKNAGTEVTSDILFLQKRDRPIDVDRDWIHLAKDENDITLNSYFAEHPEMILGTMELKSGQFGMESTCTPLPNADLGEQLQRAASNIEGNIPDAELPDMELGSDSSIPADPTVKNFSYTLVDGEVYYRENSRMVRPELNQTAKERVAGLVSLRECVNDLIRYQLEDYSDETISQEQAKLNRLYDNFTAKYGLINSRGNSLAFAEDNSYYLLCSLEDMDESGNLKAKADMFTKRTIKKRVSVTSVDTASEALALSIAEKAKVDIGYMEQLTGLSSEQIATDLRGVIFCLPDLENEGNPHYVTADEYLSGDVRKKLRTAKMAARVSDMYAPNVSALEAAQPKDLEAAEIDVRLGATWIDKEYVQQFMYELFDTPWRNQDQIEVKYAPFTAEWNITGKSTVGYNNVAAYVTYGTDRTNAYKILEDTLNLRDVRIYDTVVDPDGKERRVLNKDATTLAQQKQQTIKDAFRDWIWNDADRRQTLVKKYNEKFNSIRPREYDGQHINFSGINPEISLRPHQVNAIAHILYGNNTLLAHEVGAGKTFEMVAAAMESKRLGLCQKPLFAVPNHLTEQWASEFLRLYPAANILVATKKDFKKSNRKKFCARIATGDYDAVIIGHSQFERIPMSLERQERLLREQINEILNGIEEVKASGGERFTVKQLERTKKGLEERLSKLEAQERKDDVLTFEQLGVDRLYVDEAHNYKNLFLYTKMRNVAGLSTTDAQKSSDMFMKCRYMDELTGGKGIVFATGTPVSNSMTELYTMQRYLQYSTLQKNGLSHFDCWASTFGETVTAMDARGNLTRIDNALAAMPERLQAVTDQLDNLNKQQDAAKAELGKPFPQEQELKDKVSRLATLDAELNMDMGAAQPQPPVDRVSKSSRPSVLESLKMTPTAAREPKVKHEKGREER